jgi:hypothetical protein
LLIVLRGGVVIIRSLRTLRVRVIGRVADIQIVFDAGDTGDTAHDRLCQLLRGIARNRARQSDLGLNGGGGDEVVLERLRGVQSVHHIHFDLPIRALPGCGRRILSQRNDAAQGSHGGPRHGTCNHSLE